MAISAKRPDGPVLLRMPDSVSDAELVDRAIRGDRWGREVLYRRHAGYLLGLATRLCANRGDAEEIVQDAFISAFERLDSLRDPGALRVWLGQITVNLVRHRLRRLRLMRLLGLDRGADATLETLAAPGLHPEACGELALLDRVLVKLRTDLRIAWMLRNVEGLELTEVASVCGCSLATIKRRLSDADSAVRAHVSPSRLPRPRAGGRADGADEGEGS
ncbi:MAG TPA: RNA polymerase sigma factor [Polyangia bacterium]|nr:RNA polymerase sigma factor [Polyangia bacterium]